MRRRWRDKFAEAARGFWLGVRSEANFRIHVPAAVLVIISAAVLRCDRLEWALLVLSIGLVFAAELINTAIERLFHGLDAGAKSRIQGCLDIAAGGVLAAVVAAVAVGGLVLLPKVIELVQAEN